MKFFKLAVAVFFILCMPAVFASETGTALKADAIKKEPFSDAQTIATLAAGDKVSIFKKDGAEREERQRQWLGAHAEHTQGRCKKG
jgi:hypothetical protein